MKNISILFILMILTSCSKKIYPDLPDNNENYPSIPDYLKTNSSFNLPISIPIKEFDNSISNNIPKKINFNNEIKCPETPLPKEEKCVVKGDITLSKFKLSGENNSLKSLNSSRSILEQALNNSSSF